MRLQLLFAVSAIGAVVATPIPVDGEAAAARDLPHGVDWRRDLPHGVDWRRDLPHGVDWKRDLPHGQDWRRDLPHGVDWRRTGGDASPEARSDA